MRQVALGLICDEDQRLLTAQRLDHELQEVELLGGMVRMGEAPSCALERELHEEIGARVNVVGHVATWRTLYLGEPTAFDIFQVDPITGSALRTLEPKTHTELAYRSVNELRRKALAPALGQVVKWFVDGEFTRRYDNGMHRWHMNELSGITNQR